MVENGITPNLHANNMSSLAIGKHPKDVDRSSQKLPQEPLDSYGEKIESPKWMGAPTELAEEAAARDDVSVAIQVGINRLAPGRSCGRI